MGIETKATWSHDHESSERFAPLDALDYGNNNDDEVAYARLRGGRPSNHVYGSKDGEAIHEGDAGNDNTVAEMDRYVSRRPDGLDPGEDDHGTASAQQENSAKSDREGELPNNAENKDLESCPAPSQVSNQAAKCPPSPINGLG